MIVEHGMIARENESGLMRRLNMNTHLHITSWVLAIILLIVVLMLHKQGKAKAAKIVHMILRLDFLLILYSGGELFSMYFSGANMLA